MRLHGVLIEEERTPAGAAPIRWLLLTTLPVDTPHECRRIVEYYSRRWRIEDWHRILESGCKVEELAHRTAARLTRAAAVNLVVAWRIFLMTLLSRDEPDLPRTSCSANSRSGAARTGPIGRVPECERRRTVSSRTCTKCGGWVTNSGGTRVVLAVQSESGLESQGTGIPG